MKRYLIIICLICASCTSLRYKPVKDYRSDFFKAQLNKVTSLYWKGSIMIETNKKRLKGSILVVAKRSPLLIRAEISNWLGGTFAIVFIKGEQFVFISTKENIAYIGNIPEEIKDQLWSFVRAIPLFSKKTTLKKLKIEYKNYVMVKDTAFAQQLCVYSSDSSFWLRIKIKEADFNISIPSELFTVNIPSGFKLLRYQVPIL